TMIPSPFFLNGTGERRGAGSRPRSLGATSAPGASETTPAARGAAARDVAPARRDPFPGAITLSDRPGPTRPIRRQAPPCFTDPARFRSEARRRSPDPTPGASASVLGYNQAYLTGR